MPLGARPEGRRGGVEPARLGPPDRQDPPRPAAARRPAGCRARLPTTSARRSPTSTSTRSSTRSTRSPQETGKTVPQIALNWLLQRPTVATVIIGARNEEQLRQNLGAVGWNLTPEQVARLDAATATTPAYPYWHQSGLRGAESAAGVRGLPAGGVVEVDGEPDAIGEIAEPRRVGVGGVPFTSKEVQGRRATHAVISR